jgi:predicted RNA-binding protein
MNDKKRNYYMLITPPVDFQIDLENNLPIAGFPDRNANSVKKFKKGDRIVYYITKKYVFGAISEVTGEYYYDKSQVWSDWYNLWPHRVETKPIYKIDDFNEMIKIKNIWDDLNFIKQKKKWGVYVQGSFKYMDDHDYKIIEKEFKKKGAKV